MTILLSAGNGGFMKMDKMKMEKAACGKKSSMKNKVKDKIVLKLKLMKGKK